MPSVKLSVPHQTTREDATQRLKGLLDKVKTRHQDKVSDLEETWTDHRLQFGFKTYGFTIRGSAAVEPAEVLVEIQIPFAAIMFKGQIEQAIREQVVKAIGKTPDTAVG